MQNTGGCALSQNQEKVVVCEIVQRWSWMLRSLWGFLIIAEHCM